MLDDGAVALPLRAPRDVLSSYGGLQITTSSTALSSLTEALIYLTKYPFNCSEQIASRVLGILSLYDVLDAFEAPGLPSREDLENSLRIDLEDLIGRQHDTGGFAPWKGRPHPFYTAHVVHALLVAREAGFAIEGDVIEAGMESLAQEIDEDLAALEITGRRAETIRAYALWVRHRAGQGVVGEAARLVDASASIEGMSLDAQAWLVEVLATRPEGFRHRDRLLHALENRVTETAGAAHMVTRFEDGDQMLMHSDRRSDALVLGALMGVDPTHDLIAKLVRGLDSNRINGRWRNTQENVFVLLALRRYFDRFEGVEPDFETTAWLGDKFAGSFQFKGRTADRKQLDVPMEALLEMGHGAEGPLDLLLHHEGAGRLYWRAGLEYAPADHSLPGVDRGFVVERHYEAVDDPGDLWRDEEGGWHVKEGARVRVILTLVAPAARWHVAFVDPLPAGLETLNPALPIAGGTPVVDEGTSGGEGSTRGFWFWRGPWYDHENLRDDRVEVFATRLGAGVHRYAYIARATTPGRFIVAPLKAEEMYSPETFGRSEAGFLIVESADD